jgi:hypothetical protein
MHVRPRFASLLLFGLIAASAGTADAQISPIIYLNRCLPGDCNLTSGASNSIANTSPVPQGGGGTYTLSPFAHGDTMWNEMVACVRDRYLPYGAEIVEVEPGPGTQYHEIMIGGTPDEVGQPANVLGQAAGGGGPTCQAVNNAISFAYANAHPPSAEYICETALQESGHTWGLDHEYECGSPMTYLPRCGHMYFRNRPLPCGEYAARACSCTGTVQNSHTKLMSIFGPGAPIVTPIGTLNAPAEGSVSAGFGVSVTTSAPRGIGTVELWLNGYKWDSKLGNFRTQSNQTITFNAPGDLPDGVIDIEVRVYDDLEQSHLALTRTVTKGAPCSTADTCLLGQSCDAGKCYWPPASGNIGDECTYNQFCLSGSCAPEGVCATQCQTTVSGDCPEGFECVSDGGTAGFCLEGGGGGGGGGCSADSSSSGTESMLIMLGLVGIVGLARSRRKK